MPLASVGIIEIPGSSGRLFDHGAFDPKTRRVFVAHTGCNCVEVIDHDSYRHVGTLHNFPEAAGVVADEGQVLVTNRRAASLVWLDGETLETRAVFPTGPRPNGVAIISHRRLAVVACIGDETHGAELQVLSLDGDHHWSIDLRPRWCVTDTAGRRVFLAIREPSMILTAELPRLDALLHWKLPSIGAQGSTSINKRTSCTLRATALSSKWTHSLEEYLRNGPCQVCRTLNFSIRRLGMAIGDPGLVQTIDPRTGAAAEIKTGPAAKTTALVAPEHLYVFSPSHRGVLVLAEA